jgi:hypothetical protein
MTKDEQILLGTLVWLRNHYDLRLSPVKDKELKGRVIKVVDLVIDHYGPSIEGNEMARAFRHKMEERGNR